jgi:uncharacterized protein
VPGRRIVVTGATGLIGGALAGSLEQDGHVVHRVTRDPSKAGHDDIVWDPDAGEIDADALEGADGVVHLAGEPIGASRWTAETKRRIRESRERGTSLIARTLAELDDPPSVLVSGSAVGYYGDRGDEVLTEDAAPGDDFVAGICVAWERATAPAEEAGIRVLHARTGVVLAPGSPLIDKIELPFRLGVGGRVGSGRQYVPWIALEDQVRALRYLLDHASLSGPINLTAPDPATNAELTRTIGDVLRRPTILPIPMAAIRLMYGEMGESLAGVSQRVVPTRLQEAGFSFQHTLTSALRVALRKAG